MSESPAEEIQIAVVDPLDSHADDRVDTLLLLIGERKTNIGRWCSSIVY